MVHAFGTESHYHAFVMSDGLGEVLLVLSLGHVGNVQTFVDLGTYLGPTSFLEI